MKKRLLTRLIAAALVPLLFAGCEQAPQPPLVFGASAWPGYEPVYLARELGYLQGANLRLDAYASPEEAEEAIRSGKANLVGVTLERALLLRSDLPDLKVILLFDSAPPSTPTAEGKTGGGRRSQPARRIDVLVTRDESIGRYHRELGQFLGGWRRALDYMRSDPDNAMKIMAQREHLAPAQFKALLDGMELYSLQRNQQLMIGEPAPIGSAVEAAQRALLNEGKLRVGVDPSMLLDSTILAESPK